MKRTLFVALGLTLMTPALFAADDKTKELTDAVEILRRVDAAAKAVNAVKYDATFKTKGGPAARAIEVEGTVILSGWQGGGAAKFRYEAKVKKPGSSEVTKISLGGDGETFFVIDHAAKKAYVDIDPAVSGTTGRPARNLATLEFVHSSPFSDELNGTKQELTGSKTIGGVDCYVVHVVYANAAQEAIWYFSKKDFLPRGREDIFIGSDGERTGRVKFLTNVVVDPKLDAGTFAFSLPEGYTKTDDFAP